MSTRQQNHNDLEILGQVESHPIGVGSAGSDSESDSLKKFAQSHGSTDHSITSHRPTLPSPSSASRIDLHPTSQSSKASRTGSVSHARTLPGNTGLFPINSPACEDCCETKVRLFISCRNPAWLRQPQRQCIHDVCGNEDPVKVTRVSRQESVIQVTTQQPVLLEISSDGDDRSGTKTTPSVRRVVIPVRQWFSAKASAHSDSPDDSDLPISRTQERQHAARLRVKSLPDSSEDSDPPINPSQKRCLARRHPARSDSSEESDPPIGPSQKRRLTKYRPVKSDRQIDSSEDSDLPIDSSQKQRLARHHPVKSDRQTESSEDSDQPIESSQKQCLARRYPTKSDSSEDSDPPINPSQKRCLTKHHPAISKGRPGNSEDSDPSLTFATRRPLTKSQYTGPNDADSSDPSTMRINPAKSQTFGGVGVDASDAGVPLASSLNRIQERLISSSPAPHLEIKSLLQASGTEGFQRSRIGLDLGASVLGEPSTIITKDPIQGSKSPKNLTVLDERQYPIPVISQTGNLIGSIQVVRSTEPVSSQTTDAEVSVEVVEQELHSPKPRESKKENALQTPSLGNRATSSTKKRPMFGIKDILPEAVSSKRRSFTLKDVIPSKTLREQIPPGGGSKLTEFHDALRMSFAPVIVAPDWILNAPLKKRKFTLADVTGTGPQEPLFSIEYALEQYLTRQSYQKQPFANQTSDQPQGVEFAIAKEQEVVPAGGDTTALSSNDSNDSNGERANYDSQHIVESTVDRAAGPDWTEMIYDAQDYLAGDENVASTKRVEVTSSES